MSNLPIEFKTSDIVTNSTLHLSYAFDVLNAVEKTEEEFPVKQDTPINVLQLSLTGKTSNPSFSIAINGTTKLFSLNSAYVTDTYPHMKDYVKKKAFVIEGYSLENINKERALIYLPMTLSTDTKNVFYPLEDAILNNTPLKSLTFDNYIPDGPILTDYFTYYTHTDKNGCLYHVIYYDTSSLGYTSALVVPENNGTYRSEYKVINYRADTVAKRHDNMTNQFEDNIYIDCVPVDLYNKSQEKYLKIDDEYGKIIQEILMYVAFIIIMSLVIYGVYYLNVAFSTKA